MNPCQVLGKFYNHYKIIFIRSTCTMERCSSVVPGGVSTKRRSSPPQSTSRNNCFMRPVNVGKYVNVDNWLFWGWVTNRFSLVPARSQQHLRQKFDFFLQPFYLSMCNVFGTSLTLASESDLVTGAESQQTWHWGCLQQILETSQSLTGGHLLLHSPSSF